MPSKNYYRILGLTQKADEKEIRRRFRDLARKYHPDVNPNASPDRFHEINEAYQVLSDTKKRARYDLELRNQTRDNVKAAYSHTSSAYTRPQRPKPSPAQPHASHRRPPDPEPVRGPVHSSAPTSSEAIAGISLAIGMFVCAILAYTGLQVLNVLAGDPQVTLQQELTREEVATAQAEIRAELTAEAVPTLVARRDFVLNRLDTAATTFSDDPLFQVLHGELPAGTETCVIDLSLDQQPCPEAARISSITGAVRDGRVSVRVRMDKQSDNDTNIRRAVFVIHFSGSVNGIALNIGDSRQNNADGKRAISSDPVHNAEVVIDDGDFFVYGYSNDCTTALSTLIYGENDFVESGSRLIVEITDQQIRWINDLDGQILESRCLFQLGGQSEGREQSDWEIFAGLNRAIRTGTSQRGNGVSSVEST